MRGKITSKFVYNNEVKGRQPDSVIAMIHFRIEGEHQPDVTTIDAIVKLLEQLAADAKDRDN
jgi:phage terminase large subunit-like protein